MIVYCRQNCRKKDTILRQNLNEAMIHVPACTELENQLLRERSQTQWATCFMIFMDNPEYGNVQKLMYLSNSPQHPWAEAYEITGNRWRHCFVFVFVFVFSCMIFFILHVFMCTAWFLSNAAENTEYSRVPERLHSPMRVLWTKGRYSARTESVWTARVSLQSLRDFHF